MKKEKSKSWLEFRKSAPQRLKNTAGKIGRWLGKNFALTPKKTLDVLKNGLCRRNYTLLLLLAICSALAVGAALKSSLMMGLCTTAALVLCNLLLTLLGGPLPEKVSATAYAILLGRPEPIKPLHTPGYAAVEGLAMGLGFTLSISLLGAIREILGKGKLWEAPLFPPEFRPALLLVAPCGGLILLGCAVALVRHLGRSSCPPPAPTRTPPAWFTCVQDCFAFFNPPKCFRGIPIALVTAGLLAMVLMGFLGVGVQ